MTDRWRFSGVERLFLFTALFVQWTLIMLVAQGYMAAHGTVTASDAQAFEGAYWVFVAMLAFGLLARPAISMATEYAPRAYRTIKTKVTQ